jgi:alkylated DNA repair dioxygenase AlkB
MQPIPNLTLLQFTKQTRRELGTGYPPSGWYCLDTHNSVQPCDSSVLLVRKAISASTTDFEELKHFMQTRVATDVSVFGPIVPRKQCTFGPYRYKQYQLFSNVDEWPSLVNIVLAFTQQLATGLQIPNPDKYNAVHTNYYADGDSTVMKHSDMEHQLVLGAPIFSFTFIEDNDDSRARPFTIFRKREAMHIEPNPDLRSKYKLVDIVLQSGDLLVMQGDMQTDFEHSIERVKTDPAPRINLTVRQFVDATVLKRKPA